MSRMNLVVETGNWKRNDVGKNLVLQCSDRMPLVFLASVVHQRRVASSPIARRRDLWLGSPRSRVSTLGGCCR